jgi:hypothetical protein
MFVIFDFLLTLDLISSASACETDYLFKADSLFDGSMIALNHDQIPCRDTYTALRNCFMT